MHGSVPFGILARDSTTRRSRMTEVTPNRLNRRVRRVAPLALVAILAVGCGDDDKGTATPATPLSPKTTTAESTPTPTPKAPPGTGTTKSGGKAALVIAEGSLFPFLGKSIRRFAPTQVQGTSLRVISLVGPDGFWAGKSRSLRIFVKMRLKGGAPPALQVGKKVDFVGLLTAGAGAGALGVTSSADKALLAKQGAYVDASAADVKPH
jgi:hypothetical protein